MKWRINISDKALKGLKKLNKQDQVSILDFLRRLENTDNPRVEGKALLGIFKGLWRYRVGNYRLICEFRDRQFIILVLKVGHRKDIYR